MPKKMTFDEAKAKWLKDVVKGRSWVQLMDDRDAEIDAKVSSLMTPEYLAIWKRASIGVDKEDCQSTSIYLT